MLYTPSEGIRIVQHMIAEFAIFANAFVGEYLNSNLAGDGIFKSCDAKSWLADIYPGISGRELLNKIITNGICAEYTAINASHDLVGMPSYCHFTSPLRRLSDCICHYLLKYIYLNYNKSSQIEIPFNKNELEIYANTCHFITKKIKRVQFADTKFRLIQIMSMAVSQNIHSNCNTQLKTIKLTYYKSSFYKGRFLNIIICKLNDFDIYISYTIKIKLFNNIEIEFNKLKTIDISVVNINTHHDEGTFPELDIILLNLQ
jgi:hypothetical protein